MRDVPQTTHMEHPILRDVEFIKQQYTLFELYVSEDVEFIEGNDMLKQQIDAFAAVSREIILLIQLVDICRVANDLIPAIVTIQKEVKKDIDTMIELTQGLIRHLIENAMDLRGMMKKEELKKKELKKGVFMKHEK